MKASLPTGPLDLKRAAERHACTVLGCSTLVAHGTKKPWCSDHVLTHSPYVQGVLRRERRRNQRARAG